MGHRGPVRTWTPLKRSMLESSIWRESSDVCKLWVTLLLIADEPGRRGTVDIPLDLLAARARMTEEATTAALAVLMAPDPRSRTRSDEGRRLRLIEPGARDWGWALINWERHRVDSRTLSLSQTTEPDEVGSPGDETPTNSRNTPGGEVRGGEKKVRKKARSGFEPPTLEEWIGYGKEYDSGWPVRDIQSAFDHYVTVGWTVGERSKPMRDWRAAARNCASRWREKHPEAGAPKVQL